MTLLESLQAEVQRLLALFSNYKKSMEPPVNPDLLMPWDGPTNNRHNLRAKCDLAGLLVDEKNTLSQVINCESGYDNHSVNYNRNNKGVVTSIDYGIFQINTRYHIGPQADFPSVEYVLQNPDKVCDWYIEMYKAGHLNWWCAFENGSYKNYSA